VRLRTLKRVRCGLYDFFRFTRIPAAIRATLKKKQPLRKSLLKNKKITVNGKKRPSCLRVITLERSWSGHQPLHVLIFFLIYPEFFKELDGLSLNNENYVMYLTIYIGTAGMQRDCVLWTGLPLPVQMYKGLWYRCMVYRTPTYFCTYTHNPTPFGSSPNPIYYTIQACMAG
jgi:hypothetical protein